jgi:hypothetical protein
MPKFNRKEAKRVARFQREQFGPEAIAREAPALFELLRNSPMFANALRLNAAAGNRVQAGVAGRGGGTGIGALAAGAGRGAAGFGASNLFANLGSEALEMTDENIARRQASLAGINHAFAKKTFGEKLMGAAGGALGGLLGSGGNPLGALTGGLGSVLGGGGGGGGGAQFPGYPYAEGPPEQRRQ